jgi:Flp pilus assembly protein TadD
LTRIHALYADRLAALRSEVDAHPGELGPAGSWANLQMELYRLDRAEAAFTELLQAFPDHSSLLYNLGLTYGRRGEPCRAADKIRRAIEVGLNEPGAWNNLGLASWRCGDVEAAAAAFLSASALDPRYWHAAANQGRMFGSRGEREKARDAFLEAKRRVLSTGASTTLVDLYLEQLESN